MRSIWIGVMLTVLLLATGVPGAAQRENVWVITRNAGLDFNSGHPVAIQTGMIGYGEATASVCDESGTLLFYTEGSYVWNRNGNLMPNGINLTQLPVGFPNSVTGSSTQGALIVPMPGNPDRYYVFSITSLESGFYGNLYYSVIDMRLNNGLGDVAAGQKGILLDTRITEKMTAIVGDRCNIWLLVHAQASNSFRAWEISDAGISDTAVVSNAGSFLFYDVGMLSPSFDRRKLVACLNNGLELFDFDPLTGIVSNASTLDRGSYYGAVFSPDGTKVYASMNLVNDTVFQFNLASATPADSKTGVGRAGFTQLKTAPDGKIYLMGMGNGLSVIHAPNVSGSGCQFDQDAIALLPGTAVSNGGLPNVVPVIRRDTLLSAVTIDATRCWANANLPSLKAQDDSSGWDYLWSTGDTGARFAADSPGSYWVSYRTPPCNYRVDTFHLFFSNGVLPSIHTRPECGANNDGGAYAETYPGDPINYSYTWMRGTDVISVADTLTGVSSGNYQLRIRTGAGCDTLLTFVIPEINVEVSFEVSDSLICLGDTLGFLNTSDTYFERYFWAFGNGDTLGMATPPPYLYPEAGAYRLMLAGSGALCADTAYKVIYVDEPIMPGFQVEPKALCVGEQAVFFPKTDSTTVQLAWEIGGEEHPESRIQSSYRFDFDSAGVVPVTLTVYSRACPEVFYTDSVSVYALPEVDLGDDTTICPQGGPVYLRNLRDTLGGHRRIWSTGATTETLKVTQPGVYTLSVHDEVTGCTGSDLVTIRKGCYIDIPNVFTPNGDGINDYFFPRQLMSESLNRFRMQVYNRWGQLLFETGEGDDRGWDGRFNGDAQPTGVYIYLIEADFADGRQEKYEGNVTLLR